MLLLFLSCSGPPCPEGSIRQDDGLCYLPEEDTAAAEEAFGPQEPEMSAAEAVAAMEQALSWGLVDAITIFDVYVEFLSQRDLACPPMENKNSTGYSGVWATLADESCTAESGYTYFGLALFSEMIENAGEEFKGQLATTDRWSYSVVASFELTDPDGQSFTGGGTAIHSWEQLEDDSIEWEAFLGGTFQYGPAGGWMGAGIDASLFMDGSLVDGRQVAHLQGGIGYPGVDVSFDDFTFDSAVGYPEGTFRVRDATGHWFSMVLGEGGCGPMVWREQDMGEHCIQVTPAMEALLQTVEADPR